jgi:hypothetical protein
MSARDKIKAELLRVVAPFNKFSEGSFADIRIVPPLNPGEPQSYVVVLPDHVTPAERAKLPTESHGFQVRYDTLTRDV